MRIGLIPELFTLDVEHNIIQMLKWLKKFEGENLGLICFGEACLQGFNALNADYEHDLAMAISQDDGVMARLQEACRRANTGLGFGYIEKTRAFCTAVICLSARMGACCITSGVFLRVGS